MSLEVSFSTHRVEEWFLNSEERENHPAYLVNTQTSCSPPRRSDLVGLRRGLETVMVNHRAQGILMQGMGSFASETIAIRAAR